jgi:hypothetical protein
MIPEFPDFKPLGPEDRDELQETYHASAPLTCDVSPTNLYLWRDCQAPILTRIRGNLCVLLHSHAEPPYFLPPLGENNLPETVRICLSHIGQVSRVPAHTAMRLPSDEFAVTPQRDSFDYIYRVQTLAELKGKGFDGKRNHIRKFARSHPQYEFQLLEASHRHHATALFDAWTSARENGRSGTLAVAALNHDCQRRALERAFEDYALLGLLGGALLVRGEIQGFMVGSRGAGDSAIAHLSYANAEMPGVYQTLLWEACRRLFSSFTYLNLEEDLGIPGLRKTKLSWQPLRLEEKFLVTLRTHPSPH